MEYYNTDFMPQMQYPVTELAPPAAPEGKPAEKRESRFWNLFRNQCLAALILCAGILSMEFWWPSGVQAARKWLVCQEIGPVEAAVQTLVLDLREGEPVSDAVTAFCQELLDSAALPTVEHAQD